MSDANDKTIDDAGFSDEVRGTFAACEGVLTAAEQRAVDELIETGWKFSDSLVVGLGNRLGNGQGTPGGSVRRDGTDAAADVLAALAAFAHDCDGGQRCRDVEALKSGSAPISGSADLLIHGVMQRIAGLNRAAVGEREAGAVQSEASGENQATDITASVRERSGSHDGAGPHEDVLTDVADDALFTLSNNGYNTAAVPGPIAAEARAVMATLQLLELQTRQERAAIAYGAEALFARTLAGVQVEIEASAGRMKLDAEPSRFSSGLRGVRVADVGGALAAAVVLLGVSVPVVTAMRDKSRIAFCGNNLKQIGAAMGQYATDWQRKMPTATAGLGGGVWWNVGKAGQSNSENMFVLSRERYAPVESMGCAGSDGCMTSMCPTTRDYTCHKNVSYSMQLPRCGEELVLDGPRRTVVADRNAATSRALRGEMMDVLENSPNHGGRGQQLLDNGGAITWASEPRDPSSGDLLWIPRPMELQITATGRRWMKPLQGLETPEKGDVMLGP